MNTLKLGSRGDDVRRLQLCLSLYPDGIFGPITEEAVKKFQEDSNLVVDGIVGSATWGALGFRSTTRRITKIILHCTATPEGKDYTVEQIRQWHLAGGFSDIGYHYIIYRDGSIHPGRAEHIVGAHCTGQNACSIGITYVGGLASDGKTPKDTRTPEQKAALHTLIDELRTRYPNVTIHCHNEFANKACPSFKICDL